ncbi:hypothetical protein LTR64_000786 [Lithohypha guttulata]|uniref:uncharacterized protein n=1 Tax=Lithohypha guttulata TaxID=1690604 RepID=UPI002DE01300|nr:hypothetical protein LTR51_005448 [Lithohypha guttulata]
MSGTLSSQSSSSSSPDTSPAIAPAKRSVRELLAELSDSDEDVSNLTTRRQEKPKSPSAISHSDEASDEDDLLVGGGRLTARLAGAVTSDRTSTSNEPLATDPVTRSLEREGEDEPALSRRQSSDEEEFRPKKRMLLKRKRQTTPSNDLTTTQQSAIRDPSPSTVSISSPLFVSSPGRKETATSAGKSRFQVLVEKARNERLAREEAEQAKQEARQAQLAVKSPERRGKRGSSPADDSGEDSDRSEIATAKRLTKDARPTRKASKKALEEMNRETQRMHRNMQLAHQATTKKKFTKESFFASFNHALPTTTEVADQLDSSSSVPPSDAEAVRSHTTPPTSPLRSPVKDTSLPVVVDQAVDNEHAEDDTYNIPNLRAIASARKLKAISKEQMAAPDTQTLPPTRVLIDAHHDNDSDSDIEVVYEKASKRKYAAFENLPKRKARQTQSHLALRSLAHVKPEKDGKSSISRADMAPFLLRAARMQALEERRAKIDKLKAAGVVVQTVEEKEQEEEELEDLVERARQEDEEIRKREKELAKKEGTYQKDALDDDDSDEDDEDFDPEDREDAQSGSEEDGEDDGQDADDEEPQHNPLVDESASETEDEAASDIEPMIGADNADGDDLVDPAQVKTPIISRSARPIRVILDDDEDEEEPAILQKQYSPSLPPARETPQSLVRSGRKVIPGLQHSDDLPLGLTQAFAATMADYQTPGDRATQEQDSLDILRDLPSPHIGIVPRLNRAESLDMISECVADSQPQSMNLDLALSQTQQIHRSPAIAVHRSQTPFEPTQDAGYLFSPYTGNRFGETPSTRPYSTEETIDLPQVEDSPIPRRKGKLQRGRQAEDEEISVDTTTKSVFHVMKVAAKRGIRDEYMKKKSEARRVVDEAAEESDDEYAGLGGASDDESGEENEEDRRMIDEDTQVGRGDEAKLAKLHADREREADAAGVSKLLKDITTGALRRKRGAGDDLDLSDDEDVATRRQQAKQREFARMRRELLKNEAVSKIAEDKRKEAFLRSIEDRDADDEGDDEFDQPETSLEVDSQDQSQPKTGEGNEGNRADSQATTSSVAALKPLRESQLNIGAFDHRRARVAVSQKPGTLAEIRESVSFLIEEPESQAGLLDLGLSDSEEEPEAYVDLDRHFQQAEADEEDEKEDLGDFVVADDNRDSGSEFVFKKPELPSTGGSRAPYSERRTKAVNVVDRLSLRKQTSSSSSISGSASELAFSIKAGSSGLSGVPSLLRRATTNSSLSSVSGRGNTSNTGVVTNEPERGSAAQEKEFVRKGANTSRNAINYQGRQNLKEEKMSARAGIVKQQQQKKTKKNGSFLTGLFRGDTWA